MIKILVVDDQRIVRAGLCALLQEQATMEVVGEAASGEELRERLARGVPAQVILLESQLFSQARPEGKAWEPIRHLTRQYSTLQFLILSGLENQTSVWELLEAGICGYLPKSIQVAELVYAIQSVARGEFYLSPALALQLIRQRTRQAPHRATAKPAVSRSQILTSREREVHRLIAEGLSNAQIADQLGLSKRTIDSHRQHMIEKTGCKNTAMLIRYAFLNGLL